MADAGCKIERAKELDINLMLDLWNSIPGLGVGQGDEKKSLEVFLARNPATCLVLKDNEQLIGTVLGGFDGRRGYIYHLAVHPDYRGRGYGEKLFNHVIQELKRLGALKIHLFVYGDNHTAISFYQSQKWELRRDIQVFSWDAGKSDR
ncbi:MAG: GNAT family N-acetyltransferase [Syntrophomonadaceae bacterium]|nr:GNAT family N-acetyltransferase [Syntrophomonadaceae bacterium]MDD3889339.1 GNAT family N-acetyltransferase [Syntrophomonadaceae bacterium]MDD4549755.1 GNAT family N-acetyltransferase [Syntrophomonadaceae bacterium]